MGKKSPKKTPKLHYKAAEGPCYLLFSPNSYPSAPTSNIQVLSVSQTWQKFGFHLLCDDLLQSVREAEKFREKFPTEGYSWPPELNRSKGYGIDTGGLDFLVVYKVSEKTGYGVYSDADLGPGRIISEYVGEWKSRYTRMDDTYTFISNHYKIDPKNYGNIARFFNHCPSKHPDEKVMTANVGALGWKISKDITKVFFITIRDIKAGEPICWDYGKSYAFPGERQYFNANTPHEPLPAGSIKDHDPDEL